MPMDYRIDRSERLVHVCAWDVLTAAEVERTRDALLRDPAFTSQLALLVDCTGVSDVTLGARAVGRLAEADCRALAGPLAIVASRDVVFGVARMYAILSDREHQVEVFRDRHRALRWIAARARAMRRQVAWPRLPALALERAG